MERSRGAWATRATLRHANPRAEGVAEGAADDEVHLQYGLGCQRSAAVGGVEEPFVERLETGGTQPADGDASQRRQDVTLRLAAVAIPGARS